MDLACGRLRTATLARGLARHAAIPLLLRRHVCAGGGAVAVASEGLLGDLSAKDNASCKGLPGGGEESSEVICKPHRPFARKKMPHYFCKLSRAFPGIWPETTSEFFCLLAPGGLAHWQARVFLTPSLEEHSLWIFDHATQKVVEPPGAKTRANARPRGREANGPPFGVGED